MRKIALILSLTAVLAGCSGTAIFQTLENEEKVRDTNNFNSSTPVNGFSLFKQGGTNYYIANGRQLWYSQAGSSDNPWASVSLSGFSNAYVVPSAAEHNGKLYFTVSDEDNSSANVLFSLDTVSGTPTELIRFGRTDVSGKSFRFHNIHLHPVKNGMYISKITRSWASDSSDSSSLVSTELYYYDGGDGVTAASDFPDSKKVTLPSGISAGFIVKDAITAENTNFLIINQASSSTINAYEAGVLLTADATSEASSRTLIKESSVPSGTKMANVSFNNIYYASAHKMLLISTRGSSTHPIRYKIWGGSSWGDWKEFDKNDNDTQFSAFVDISKIKADTILVGTRADVVKGSTTTYSGDGYFELNVADTSKLSLSDNTFSSKNNYSSASLNKATITRFYFDDDNGDKIYTATGSNGIWQNRHSTSDNARIWYQE